MIPSWNCAAKMRPTLPLLNCCNNMGSRPAGRVWPNTAASSWKAAKSASGGNGRKPRQPQISRPRLKVRQPWPQNPRRPRQRRPLRSAGNVTPPPKEDSPYRSRGPHIANVRMMTAERTGRIRGQPETETASELTQPGKQSGDAPASPRCPARQPERLISRPATSASHTQPQRFGRRPDKPVTPP